MDRRVRTFWVVRQRYQRAGWIASLVGAIVGLILVTLVVRLDLADGQGLSGGGLLACAILLAAFAVLPRVVVRLMWRSTRQRHFWDWQ